jgi:hypothetical protein
MGFAVPANALNAVLYRCGCSEAALTADFARLLRRSAEISSLGTNLPFGSTEGVSLEEHLCREHFVPDN